MSKFILSNSRKLNIFNLFSRLYLNTTGKVLSIQMIQKSFSLIQESYNKLNRNNIGRISNNHVAFELLRRLY